MFQRPFASFSARDSELFQIQIGPDNHTLVADHPCQIKYQVSTTAPNIQATHRRLHTHSLQQRYCAWSHYPGKNAKPFSPLYTAANDVVALPSSGEFVLPVDNCISGETWPPFSTPASP